MSLTRAAPLARRLAWPLGLAFAVALAGLLGVSAWIGNRAMRQEHELAGLRMAALFESSLRNAMLKRDLDGLRQILADLGEVPGLRAAALATPGGEVRFASRPQRLGEDAAARLDGLCLKPGCAPLGRPSVQWTAQPDGGLQVAYPVLNRPACLACHGSVAEHPVNGVLLLDFAPPTSERTAQLQARQRLLPLTLAILGLLALATALLLRREVLAPVGRLLDSMQRFGRGAQEPAGQRVAAEASQAADAVGADAALSEGARGRAGLESPRGSDASNAGTGQASLSAPSASGTGTSAAAPSPSRPDALELQRLHAGFGAMADRVQSQIDALDAQQRFLQALLDASPDAVLVIGADHRIVLANAAYARLVGRPMEAVLGAPCFRVSRGRSDPCPATLVDCPLQQCRAGAPGRTVMAFTDAQGQQRDVEIDAAALQATDGEQLIVEMIRPLEERVRFSQEQRLSAIGLLANGVAHEVHNPLAAIRLALQSCLRGIADGSMPKEEVADYLNLVDAQIDRCVLITQRLLRLSQMSAEIAQPVQVLPAVQDVLGLLGEEARRAGVTIETAIAPESLRVLMDEGELRQVLVNLVQNALHAMRGGGLLRVEAAREAPARVRLSVIDHGSGIPPEQLGLIFLPFYSRRGDGQRGTGLGLAIVKGLVEGRGGHISASSRLGEGSRFDVVLDDADADVDVGAGAGAGAGVKPSAGSGRASDRRAVARSLEPQDPVPPTPPAPATLAHFVNPGRHGGAA